MKNQIRWSLSVVALLLAAMFVGCDGGEATTAEAVAEHVDEAAGHAEEAMADVKEHAMEALEATPAINAVLAKADLVDGSEDKIVANCPGCALAMEGSADHAMEVGEYHLHFCSDECKHNFGENAAQAIMELPVGEGDTGDSAD